MDVSIMKLLMEKGWWWRRRWIPLSGARNGLQIRAPDEEQEVAAAPYRKTWWNFSLDFFRRRCEFIASESGQGDTRGPTSTRGARPRGAGRAPCPCGPMVALFRYFFIPVFFIYSKIILQKFPSNSEHFYFCTKTTPWQFYWKQRQSGLVSLKSCKLEVKTRAKVFGKVDTLETYQLPQA